MNNHKHNTSILSKFWTSRPKATSDAEWKATEDKFKNQLDNVMPDKLYKAIDTTIDNVVIHMPVKAVKTFDNVATSVCDYAAPKVNAIQDAIDSAILTMANKLDKYLNKIL